MSVVVARDQVEPTGDWNQNGHLEPRASDGEVANQAVDHRAIAIDDPRGLRDRVASVVSPIVHAAFDHSSQSNQC